MAAGAPKRPARRDVLWSAATGGRPLGSCGAAQGPLERLLLFFSSIRYSPPADKGSASALKRGAKASLSVTRSGAPSTALVWSARGAPERDVLQARSGGEPFF